MWKTLTGIFPKVGTPIACRKYTDGQFIKFGNPNSFEYLIICVKSEMKVLQTAVATVTHTADRKRFFMVKKELLHRICTNGRPTNFIQHQIGIRFFIKRKTM